MSGRAWKPITDDNDSDDEGYEDFRASSKEVMLFLIESNPTMLQEEEGEPSIVQNALECALAVMQSKILSHPRDIVAVAVYNVKSSNIPDPPADANTIYMMAPLEPLTAKSIDRLTKEVERFKQEPGLLQKTLAHIDLKSSPNQVGPAVKYLQGLFKQKSPKDARKSILLITDNDTPYKKEINSQHYTVSMNHSANAADAGIDIEPFFFLPTDKDFDISIFYDAFLKPHMDPETAEAALIPGENKFTNLLARCVARDRLKRTMFTIPMEIHKDLVISVSGYNTISEAKTKLPVKIQPERSSATEIITKTFLVDGSGAKVRPDDVASVFVADNKEGKEDSVVKLAFTKEEIRKLKTCGMKPAIKFIGFKPIDSFSPHLTLLHSYFLYPSEKLYTGSNSAFYHLLKAMLAKKVYALAVAIPRVSAVPRLVALFPQDEQVDAETGEQILAPGINMVHLPYKDDIRELQIQESASIFRKVAKRRQASDAEDEEEEAPTEVEWKEDSAVSKAADKIIEKGQINWKPGMFPNPHLKQHYAMLHALALGEDEWLKEFDDPSDARCTKTANKIASSVAKLNEALYLSKSVDTVPKPEPTKKAASGTKRKAVDDSLIDEAKILAAFKSGTEKKITNPELSAFLKSKSKKCSGMKKDQLIREVRKVFVAEMQIEPQDDDEDD